MKRLFIGIITIVMLLSLAVPAFAAEYEFSSGADTSATFGKPSSTDELVTSDPMTENTRRNKDAAYFPPPYGVFSGDIPTDATSLYHDNTPTYAGYTGDPYATGDYSYNGSSVSTDNGADYGGMLPSTSTYTATTLNLTPSYYADGSIGTLSIPTLNLSVKVYEGETVDSMKKGVGHFEFTSAWDGNIGFAGHNRGASAYFGGVKNLAIGDTITYTTPYGTRTYSVYLKEKISDTDYSYLGWSSENIVTLITCVEGVSDQRWVVQARQTT